MYVEHISFTKHWNGQMKIKEFTKIPNTFVHIIMNGSHVALNETSDARNQ